MGGELRLGAPADVNFKQPASNRGVTFLRGCLTRFG